MTTWLKALACAALVVLIPGSQGFVAHNVDLSLRRVESRPLNLRLPVETTTTSTTAIGSIKNVGFQRTRNFFGRLCRQQKPALITGTNDDSSRWSRVLSFLHNVAMSVWKRRIGRLLALWAVVTVGQCTWGICPALATSTSSVGMLTQTTGASIAVGSSIGSSSVSSFARGTAAAASSSTASLFRAFNLPTGLAVLLMAVTGGILGKKVLPSAEEKATDGGKVLQLTRKPKVEEEKVEGSVLQLERQPKAEETMEVAAVQVKDIGQDREARKQQQEAEKRRKMEGERLLEQYSRYQTTVTPAASVAIASPTSPQVEEAMEETAVLAAVAMEKPVPVEEPVEETASVDHIEPVMAVTEVAAAEPIIAAVDVEEKQLAMTSSSSAPAAPSAVSLVEDDIEMRRQDLAKTMAAGVAVILAAGAALVQSAGAASVVLPLNFSFGMLTLLLASFAGVLVGNNLLPSSTWALPEEIEEDDHKFAVSVLPAETTSLTTMAEHEGLKGNAMMSTATVNIDEKEILTEVAIDSKPDQNMITSTTKSFSFDEELEQRRQQLVQNVGGGVAIILTLAAFLQ